MNPEDGNPEKVLEFIVGQKVVWKGVCAILVDGHHILAVI